MLSKKKIVISLHGIETHGIWELDLAPIISEQSWVYYPLYYGTFSFYKLLLPYYQNKMIDWFRNKYNEVKNRYKDTVPNIIAHSFGTRIIAGALIKYPNIKFDKIILCGSIVKQDYNWDIIFKNNQATAVKNDYAGKDFWTNLPLKLIPNTGSSGSFGFTSNHPKLFQKNFSEYLHSSAFGYDHYLNEWIPFLKTNFKYESDNNVVTDIEEPINSIDAVKFSVATYFNQFIRPVFTAIQNSQAINKKITIIIPPTPGKANKENIDNIFNKLNMRKTELQYSDRNIGLYYSDELGFADVPTIINSFADFDLSELELLTTEFANQLQSMIKSPKYYYSQNIEIKIMKD